MKMTIKKLWAFLGLLLLLGSCSAQRLNYGTQSDISGRRGLKKYFEPAIIGILQGIRDERNRELGPGWVTPTGEPVQTPPYIEESLPSSRDDN